MQSKAPVKDEFTCLDDFLCIISASCGPSLPEFIWVKSWSYHITWHYITPRHTIVLFKLNALCTSIVELCFCGTLPYLCFTFQRSLLYHIFVQPWKHCVPRLSLCDFLVVGAWNVEASGYYYHYYYHYYYYYYHYYYYYYYHYCL